MLGRQMTPALKKLAVIDLTNFLLAIVWSEYAIKRTIGDLKKEIFDEKNEKGE